MDCNGNAALVIIDMQPGFKAANNEGTIANVMGAIRKAKLAAMPIYVLELRPHCYQHTIEEIANEICNYDKSYFVEKEYDNGASVLIAAMSNNDMSADHMYVCGVNSCYCVRATVGSLNSSYDKKTTVLQSACNCTCALGEHHSLYSDDQTELSCAVNLEAFNHENCTILE